MKRSKFSEHQIIAILKAVEAGRTVRDVCREHEVSDATYYKWKTKYGGMEAADIRRLRELEDENRRLKQMSAELLLENRALKDVIAAAPSQSSDPPRERIRQFIPMCLNQTTGGNITDFADLHQNARVSK